jgi:hypothetical protein
MDAVAADVAVLGDKALVPPPPPPPPLFLKRQVPLKPDAEEPPIPAASPIPAAYLDCARGGEPSKCNDDNDDDDDADEEEEEEEEGAAAAKDDAA